MPLCGLTTEAMPLHHLSLVTFVLANDHTFSPDDKGALSSFVMILFGLVVK